MHAHGGARPGSAINFISFKSIQIIMSTITISITEDVHRRLVEAKMQDESLSDVIDRLLKKEKPDLSQFFGALRNSELLDEIEEDSKRMRASARFRI